MEIGICNNCIFLDTVNEYEIKVCPKCGSIISSLKIEELEWNNLSEEEKRRCMDEHLKKYGRSLKLDSDKVIPLSKDEFVEVIDSLLKAIASIDNKKILEVKDRVCGSDDLYSSYLKALFVIQESNSPTRLLENIFTTNAIDKRAEMELEVKDYVNYLLVSRGALINISIFSTSKFIEAIGDKVTKAENSLLEGRMPEVDVLLESDKFKEELGKIMTLINAKIVDVCSYCNEKGRNFIDRDAMNAFLDIVTRYSKFTIGMCQALQLKNKAMVSITLALALSDLKKIVEGLINT